MKKLILFSFLIGFVVTSFNAIGQDRKLSPPDTVSTTTAKGVKISIAYSRPSIRGRAIGKEIAPYDGQSWRTGANEQTAISVSKPVKIEGHALPAGKYSIWTIPGEKEWTVIINRNTTNWGTDYDAPKDVFRFKVKTGKAATFTEAMKFSVDKSGRVILTWGTIEVSFMVN
jgi:hypothetical protein